MNDDLNNNSTPDPDIEPTVDAAVKSRSRRFVFLMFYGMTLVLFLALGVLMGLYFAYMVDLPEVQSLEDYQPSVMTEIYADDNTPIGQFYVERRRLVSPGDIPKNFEHAVVSIEDKSFYTHFGIDVWRIMGSMVSNIRHGRIMRGASTITQQLAKIMFLTPEVSWERKIKEAILAMQIEKEYSKERIFTFYANKIYLGHGVYGIASASDFYFGKPVKNLDLAECALLAAIIRTPERYTPVKHPKLALTRRNLVLQEMFNEGYISKQQLEAARREPLNVTSHDGDSTFAPYFKEWVRQYLQKHYSTKQIFSQGLKVYTTLNRDYQRAAEQALKDGLRNYDKRHGWRDQLPNVDDGKTNLDEYHHSDWNIRPADGDIMTGLVMEVAAKKARIRFGDYKAELQPAGWKWTRQRDGRRVLRRGDLALFRIEKVNEATRTLEVSLEQYPDVQGAFLAIDNQTGAIKAMIGGYDWEKSKFNRTTQAKRQTGSIFKPFVYSTAIQLGMSPEDTILDEPFTVVNETGEEYTPENFHKKYRGEITLREALAKSINVPAVRLGMQVGIPNVIKLARKFGIQSTIYPYPSTALGASEISLMEMVSAFSVFPNEGLRMDPFFIRRIEDHRGNILEEHRPEIHEVLSPHVAKTMISMLRGVVQYGTSVKAKSLDAEIGGKTGTTNDFTDAWFIGFTPSITAGAWVGFDEKKSLGDDETGARAALPIWIDFMKEYLKDRPPEHFPPETSSQYDRRALADEDAGFQRQDKIIEEDLIKH